MYLNFLNHIPIPAIKTHMVNGKASSWEEDYSIIQIIKIITFILVQKKIPILH